MSDTQKSGTLLAEILRTQELLKSEFHRILQLIEIQRNEIIALRHTNTTQFIPETHTSEFIDQNSASTAHPIPFGLYPPHNTQDRKQHLNDVHLDIEAAFYPNPHALHLNSAYIRYRQIQSFDLRGKRIAVLTTASTAYSDLLEATLAKETIELRLHSITGPFTLTYRNQMGNDKSETHFGDIETVFLALDYCDLLWIPDPHLSSLVLRCRGVVDRVSERVTENFIFSIRVDQWDENGARLKIHTAGFTEISRLPVSEETEYITRYHEQRGYYTHIAPRSPESTKVGTQLLIASKIPTATFQITPLEEQ